MKRVLLLLLLTVTFGFAKVSAHTVSSYSTCGYACSGSNLTIDAVITSAPSSTKYNWQFRDNSGTWKCFVNGSNIINGTSFTVSGASATGPANDAPLLTIQNAKIALENVEVRVLMAEGGNPCATNPSYSVWNGDDDPNDKYKSIRIHVLPTTDCSIISTFCGQGGCNGNLLNDANGYYGGFEASNNFASAFTNYTNGDGCNAYRIANNPKKFWSFANAFAPRSGNSMMIVDGSSNANSRVWYKSVNVTAGTNYQFSTWAANLTESTSNLPSIVLKANGNTVATGTVNSNAGNWILISGSFTVTTTGTITIEIFDSNLSCTDNDFAIDDICFKSNGIVPSVCTAGFNPVASSKGFNVFAREGVEFQNGHTDGAIAMGGNLTLKGAVNVAMSNSGSYPNGLNNSNNFGLVVGGRINYTSGSVSYLNNGFFRLGSTTGTTLWAQDPNGANVNLRATSNAQAGWTGYNSNPALQVQKQQTSASATSASDIDFNVAFNELITSSNLMSNYVSGSTCSSELNIISVSGATPTITLASNKTNVINITGSNLLNITQLQFANKPTATRPLIININQTGNFIWDAYSVTGLAISDSKYIIYNFYNCTGTITMNGSDLFYGTILAPQAAFTWNVTNNLEGQIIAKSVLICNGEIHDQSFEACLPDCSFNPPSTNCTNHTETIPNQFNTGFNYSLTNATFVGSSGTWTVNGNANATIVCTTPYYNPSTSYAIKIVNPSTSGKSSGTASAASPTVNLSTGVCCPETLSLNFTLWSYNSVSGDNNASLRIDFSSNGGSTWTEVWVRTSAQLFTAYGANGKATINVNIPLAYQTANFKYRFRGVMNSGNPNNFYVFIDDMSISSLNTCTANLALGNQVWYDSNNDGILNNGEQGVSGVTVRLYKDSNGDNVPDGAAIATTTTDDNGIYMFNNLAADKYIVGIVLPAGYAPTITTANSTNPNSDTDNDNNGITTVSGELRGNFITLTNGGEPTGGNTNETYDFGLKGTGCIGNFVWADYNGDGIQDVNEPGLENIVVTITYPNGYTKSFTTSSAGTYQFTNLAPGTYTINFTSPTGATASPANQGSDLTVDSDPTGGNVIVSITPGQCRTDIDAGFVCCIEVLNLGNLVWLDSNGNGLLDGAETGINGVTVKLYEDNDANNIPDGGAINTVTTNSSGIYNFPNLPAGKYIVGVVLPSGRIGTTAIGSSFDPTNNIDGDNNGVTTVSGEVRSNFIIVTGNNYTLDFGLRTTTSGTGSIGNYVWNDLNKNGVQDSNEPPIRNVQVTLSGASSATVITDINGYYIFPNLSSGSYIVTFSTPAGMSASQAAQGGNTALDSDPINGSVAVTLATGQNRTDIDAGFYLNTKTSSSCGTGFAIKSTTIVKNGNFSTTSLTPGAGNSFSGTNATSALSYAFTGGSFKAQAKFHGLNVKPGSERGFSLINSSSNFTDGGPVNQAPFPGDLVNSVAGSNTWMYHNGNDLGGEYLVWQQTLTGLVVGNKYTFRFYASNTIENAADGYSDPILRIRTGGTDGLPDGTLRTGPLTLTENLTSNSASLSGWVRMEYVFTATATSIIVKITDSQTDSEGDDLGITAIGLDLCSDDTDGDGVADIDDIDNDNDGILDLVESGGYNPLGDCDNDGILNYKDATPGCSTPGGNDIYGKPFVALTWADCNSDGINDFFDFDRDGIINAWDLDSDNDGITDIDETRDSKGTDYNNDGMVDGVDNDGDGLLSSADSNDNSFGGTGITPQNLDRDTTPNYLDLDSDGDGITDLTEATGIYDNDGIANGTDADADGVKGSYTNSSTVADNFNGFGGRGVKMIDTDNDGKPDPYDVDSDNDGISDNVEGQPTCSFKLPSSLDSDGDGVDNSYDLANNNCSRSSGGITPFDKEADGIPDYVDTDADNDGAPDVNEGSGLFGNFVTNFNDTDGDGMIDQFDNFNIKTASANLINNVGHNQMGPNGNFDGPVPSGSNSQLIRSEPGDCLTVDRDWRECTILPVTLIEFKGNLYNNIANLNWTVIEEKGMEKYEVQRSIDGHNYIKVATVAARDIQTKITYAAQDNIAGIATNVVYYKLRMFDKNGASKYSNVITFRLNGKKGGIAVNPNPATNYFILRLNANNNGNANIRVVDLNGKLLLAQTTAVQKGSNTITFNDLSRMASGTYIVQVQMDGELFNEKLIVNK